MVLPKKGPAGGRQLPSGGPFVLRRHGIPAPFCFQDRGPCVDVAQGSPNLAAQMSPNLVVGRSPNLAGSGFAVDAQSCPSSGDHASSTVGVRRSFAALTRVSSSAAAQRFFSFFPNRLAGTLHCSGCICFVNRRLCPWIFTNVSEQLSATDAVQGYSNLVQMQFNAQFRS